VKGRKKWELMFFRAHLALKSFTMKKGLLRVLQQAILAYQKKVKSRKISNEESKFLPNKLFLPKAQEDHFHKRLCKSSTSGKRLIHNFMESGSNKFGRLSQAINCISQATFNIL
jgi:hypothetical protein